MSPTAATAWKHTERNRHLHRQKKIFTTISRNWVTPEITSFRAYPITILKALVMNIWTVSNFLNFEDGSRICQNLRELSQVTFAFFGIF
jgi:hypothetical protein